MPGTRLPDVPESLLHELARLVDAPLRIRAGGVRVRISAFCHAAQQLRSAHPGLDVLQPIHAVDAAGWSVVPVGTIVHGLPGVKPITVGLPTGGFQVPFDGGIHRSARCVNVEPCHRVRPVGGDLDDGEPQSRRAGCDHGRVLDLERAARSASHLPGPSFALGDKPSPRLRPFAAGFVFA
jgi:hypothetical protein